MRRPMPRLCDAAKTRVGDLVERSVWGVECEQHAHTQDGYRFIIDREWAMLSGTMRMMLSTDDGGALDRLLRVRGA